MKILMYGWEFPPHISGGLGTACFGLTQALASQGHSISFILPKIKSASSEPSHVTLIGSDQIEIDISTTEETTIEIKNVKIESINSSLVPYMNNVQYCFQMAHIERMKQENRETERSLPITMSGDYGADLMSEILRYASVAGTIAKNVDHDIIHAHDWLTIPAALEAKRISQKPLVIHIHSLEFDRSGDNVNPEVYSIERAGMEKANRIIAVSQFTKNIIVKHYGINPGKIKVVHNGVARTSSFKESHILKHKRKTVLFLGRITHQKGPDYFIEAAAKVLSVRKDVNFVMAGSGDMMHDMIERVASLKIGRHFHFTGFLQGKNVNRMFRMSDLYVMPSVSEPFGISPLEAMQNGVPTIISRQSGISEVVGNVFKVNFWDTKELASKILALLEYKPLREEMIKNAVSELTQITWEKAAGSVSGLYHELKKAE